MLWAPRLGARSACQCAGSGPCDAQLVCVIEELPPAPCLLSRIAGPSAPRPAPAKSSPRCRDSGAAGCWLRPAYTRPTAPPPHDIGMPDARGVEIVLLRERELEHHQLPHWQGVELQTFLALPHGIPSHDTPTVSPLMIPLVYCHIKSFQRATSVEKPLLGGENRRDGRASHPVKL